jgi:perosamine synthetase
MERLPQMLADKRRLAERYQEIFLTIDGLSFAAEPKNSRSNYWLNTIVLDTPDLEMRNRLLGAANASGYQCRPAWTLLHRLPMYSKAPRAPLPIAERLEASLINVPSSPKLLRDRRD